MERRCRAEGQEVARQAEAARIASAIKEQEEIAQFDAEARRAVKETVAAERLAQRFAQEHARTGRTWLDRIRAKTAQDEINFRNYCQDENNLAGFVGAHVTAYRLWNSIGQ